MSYQSGYTILYDKIYIFQSSYRARTSKIINKNWQDSCTILHTKMIMTFTVGLGPKKSIGVIILA